jgi:hypothetical protein
MKRLLPLLALTLLPACSYLGLSDSEDTVATTPPAETEAAAVATTPDGAPVPTPLATPQAALAIADAWVAPTLKGAKVTAGFLTVGNAGTEPDRIVSATSPRAARIELHETTMVGTTAKMRPMKDGIQVPAVGSVELKQGGMHLMFMGIKEPFIEGQTIPATLTFEKGGSIEIVLAVKAQGAIGAQH